MGFITLFPVNQCTLDIHDDPATAFRDETWLRELGEGIGTWVTRANKILQQQNF